MNLDTLRARDLAAALSSSRGVYPSRFAIGDRVRVSRPDTTPVSEDPSCGSYSSETCALDLIAIVGGVQFTPGKVHYLVDPETQDPANASPTYLVDSAFVDEVDNDHPQSLEPISA